MKSIFFSLALILLVGTAAVGAVTGAWFTDKETMANDFSSGKLDVELRGPNPTGIVIPLDTTQNFKGGLAPGVSTERYEVQVYNKGWGQSTLPVKYRWTENFTEGNSGFYSKLNVKVEDGNCDWVTSWPAGLSIVYEGPLDDMTAVPSVTLEPNITRCTWFTFQLDKSAGNDLQGQNAKFNLVLDATQPENSGWNEVDPTGTL